MMVATVVEEMILADEPLLGTEMRQRSLLVAWHGARRMTRWVLPSGGSERWWKLRSSWTVKIQRAVVVLASSLFEILQL